MLRVTLRYVTVVSVLNIIFGSTSLYYTQYDCSRTDGLDQFPVVLYYCVKGVIVLISYGITNANNGMVYDQWCGTVLNK